MPSRFYDPYAASPQYPSLYLADSSHVAMFEAQALFGSPTRPGGPVPAPRGAWLTLTVQVQLQAVVDLSSLTAQALLDASVQELTGDWQGYAQRSPATLVSAPTGSAPTQELGEAIHRDPRGLEGFAAVSAKVPTNRTLVVFPDQLRQGSLIRYTWEDGDGEHAFVVDFDSPEGRPDA